MDARTRPENRLMKAENESAIKALKKIAGDTKEFCYHADYAKATLSHAHEVAKAQSHDAAENIYTMLESLGILPPEFKGNYLMQARLITGMAARIENILHPNETR